MQKKKAFDVSICLKSCPKNKTSVVAEHFSVPLLSLTLHFVQPHLTSLVKRIKNFFHLVLHIHFVYVAKVKGVLLADPLFR